MPVKIAVQTADYDLSAEVAALTQGNREIGAVVSFEGRVRAEDGLQALMLEHYPGMTEAEIARHAHEAEQRWPLLGISVIHRIGRLTPGERIVLVAVASLHRHAAFDAAAFLMDYLKTKAPFWKQEERRDGTHWVAARHSDEAATARWQQPGPDPEG